MPGGLREVRGDMKQTKRGRREELRKGGRRRMRQAKNVKETTR